MSKTLYCSSLSADKAGAVKNFSIPLRFTRRILLALIIGSWLLTISLPAFAAETRTPVNIKIGPTCFTQSECIGEPYKGTPSPSATPECQNPNIFQSQEAIDRGITYNCYAVQPTVKLQVSIGGRSVTGLENYIQRLYNYLLSIIGIVAGIMIVWAGIKWLTAGPLAERVEDAKKKIAGAIMGLVIALAAYVILQTINPALVNLRLPPIKLARQSQEVTEVKCSGDRGIPQFPCGGRPTERRYRVDNETITYQYFLADSRERGTYSCAKPAYSEYNPCGSAGGECKGVYCSQGGCVDIRMVRVLAPALEKIRTLEGGMANINDPPRGCFSRSECSPCESVQILASGNQLTAEGRYNLQLCASAACNCLLSVDPENNLACVRRKGAGEDCSDNAECDQSAGLTCVPGGVSAVLTELAQLPLIPAAQPPKHGKCYSPQADDMPCAEDSDCANGVCGQETGILGGATWQCTGAHGSHCGPEDLGSRCTQGLKCIDTGGAGGTCSDGRAGAPCRSIYHCRSLSCSTGPRIPVPGNETFFEVGTCW